MLLARAVSAKGVLVKTGQEQTSAHADYIADNLTQAADWIVRNHENTRN